MKNRIDRSKAEKPVTFTLEITVKGERADQFVRDAANYGLTLNEYASAMLETEIQGNEHNGFDEVGYHLMFAAIDLFPKRENYLAAGCLC
jgi:hypothetical protein